jgi:hypothetical protein
MGSLENKGNILGDVRAEHDHKMLDLAFYDWQDHKILSEGSDRYLVVGRRGTGKSALTYKLTEEWRAQRDFVVVVAPDEEDVIGLRATATKFGTSLGRIRAAIKTGWRYALIMEICSKLNSYYKTQKVLAESTLLNTTLKQWEGLGGTFISRLKKTLQHSIVNGESSEESISELASRLRVNEVTSELDQLLCNASRRVMVLIDRLDEGYEPDEVGVGIVDGIVYGSDDLRAKVGNIKTFLFLRDNVFRAIQTYDQDFTRNIEGSVLRLHWDVQELFHLVCKRIRIAFQLNVESDVRVWNFVTANELHGIQGFKMVLRLTLYRPRDLISLLNTAFYNASKANRKNLIVEDLNATARHISEIRFDDLRKEYSSVFPGITEITRALGELGPQFSVLDANDALEGLKNRTTDIQLAQHFAILGEPEEILKSLYGIGFVGLIDKHSGNAIFSHDGKRPDRLFDESSMLLIHPCYRAAIGITQHSIDSNIAEQIYDEYDITISSEVKEQRNKAIGRLISELDSIEKGNDDATLFEDWVKRAIELIAARKLLNIQLRPNGNASSRRDIVATSMALDGFWRRIREDYGSRQIIFEVKNYEKLSADEYRQCSAYLGQEYGRIGFIVCRDQQKELTKGGELEAFRDHYSRHSHLIIKLTASFLVGLLSKLRSPQKYDQIDEAFAKHLDTHIRMYANGQGGVEAPKRPRKSNKKSEFSKSASYNELKKVA